MPASDAPPVAVGIPPRTWVGVCLILVGRALANPRLALDLVKLGWAFRRRHWWRLPPFFPVPDRTYLRWRMYTAYANADAVPPVKDVIGLARWRRETMGL